MPPKKPQAGTSLLDRVKDKPRRPTGPQSWIADMPEDLVKELASVVVAYQSGVVTTSIRVIYEQFSEMCKERDITLTVGYEGFYHVFRDMKAKA